MKRSEEYVGGAFGLVFAATWLFIALMVGAQALWWLEQGTWPEYPVSKLMAELGIARPVASWRGVQKIIDEAMSMHAGIAVFVFGICTAYAVSYVVDGLGRLVGRLFGPLPPKPYPPHI